MNPDISTMAREAAEKIKSCVPFEYMPGKMVMIPAPDTAIEDILCTVLLRAKNEWYSEMTSPIDWLESINAVVAEEGWTIVDLRREVGRMVSNARMDRNLLHMKIHDLHYQLSAAEKEAAALRDKMAKTRVSSESPIETSGN